jgi:hypothetical protein
MTKYTYTRGHAAWQGERIVTVPDQVAENQRDYDNRRASFPAILDNGRRVRVRLDGEAYGLHTSGTGDMRVVSA